MFTCTIFFCTFSQFIAYFQASKLKMGCWCATRSSLLMTGKCKDWRSWFKAGFIWPHIGYRVRTKKPLDLFKQVHFTILLVVYALRYSCSILFIICVASIMLNWKIFSYFRFPWPRLRVTYSGYGLIFRVKSGFISTNKTELKLGSI